MPVDLRDLLEGVAVNDPDDIGEAGALDVGRGFLGADGIEFNGHQPAAGLAQAHADPDRRVAAGRADFEHLPGVGRADQDAQEPAILLGNGQLPLVGGPDARQQFGNRRIDRSRAGVDGWARWTDRRGRTTAAAMPRNGNSSEQHPSILGLAAPCYSFAFIQDSGGIVSPILTRPVREQLEHDRVIRLLQAATSERPKSSSTRATSRTSRSR